LCHEYTINNVCHLLYSALTTATLTELSGIINAITSPAGSELALYSAFINDPTPLFCTVRQLTKLFM